ncbi:MAG: ABC transporter ATP-binding protein [Solirubrobacterales bacterium]|nr:ABC transporter ATP-binding protein [Solirubrobacterales bacterium]
MLEVQDLKVSYGRLEAVKGISFTINQGECIGLIGPNGAGKTTTLNAIAGVLKRSGGSIAFEGEKLPNQAPEATVRRGISLVPEGRRVFQGLTVEQNLRLGASIRSDKEIDSDIEAMKKRFPALEKYATTRAGSLSGGEQQMIALARALMARPRLLLLDEPSLGLAPLIVDQVFELVDQLRSEGITILLVEQNGLRTLELADRSYVLQGGRIAMSATGAEDFAEVEKAYFGAEDSNAVAKETAND